MGVNCNLELRLLPPSAAAASSTGLVDHRHQNSNDHRGLPMLDFLSMRNNTTSEEERQRRQQQQQQQQQQLQQQQQQQRQELTIFYNGQLRVCDVTELQARAIIMHASREIMEDKPKTELALGSCCSSTLTQQSPAMSCGASAASNAASLSMKRSLQRFLQKRKHRIQAASPYSH